MRVVVRMFQYVKFPKCYTLTQPAFLDRIVNLINALISTKNQKHYKTFKYSICIHKFNRFKLQPVF